MSLDNYASACRMQGIKSIVSIGCPVMLCTIAEALSRDIDNPELVALIDMLSFHNERRAAGEKAPEIEGISHSLKALIISLT